MRCMILVGLCALVHSVLSIAVTAQDPNWNVLSPGELGSGLNEIQVKYGGEQRRLVVVVPKTFDKEKNYPILFCFHGAGGNADKQVARWGHCGQPRFDSGRRGRGSVVKEMELQGRFSCGEPR